MKKYTCAVCGNEYESILERAKCEEKCVMEAEKAAKKAMEEKLEIERKDSEKEICDALSYVNELVAQHYAKYSSFRVKGNYPYLNYIFGRTSLWF